jgi:hypothetical protein
VGSFARAFRAPNGEGQLNASDSKREKKMTDLSPSLSLSLPLTMTVGYSTKQGQARSLELIGVTGAEVE